MLPRLLPKTTDRLWYSEYTAEEQDKELDEALKAYETRVSLLSLALLSDSSSTTSEYSPSGSE
jgi:hypothetical protein